MKKLLNYSLRKFLLYAVTVLICSIPVYYFVISVLWQYELDEHKIELTPEAGREDTFLIIGAVTLVSMICSALLLGGLYLLNRRLSKRMWQPFYNSLESIRNFDLNKPEEISFEKSKIVEFDELNQSLQRLLSANVKVYSQQKEFADNASHELQTPLAIVQSKLDLLLQTQSLTSEQSHIIEEAMAALSRATHVNKNLLLLTKIENSQFAEKNHIDLSSCLLDLTGLLTPFAQDKELEWDLHITPHVSIDGNKMLVEILLNNLLTNAIRHANSVGLITVNLQPGKLSVSNDGDTSLKSDQLFKRFSSSSEHSPGTGVGLALVKEICNRYDWNVKYSFINGRHTFSVSF